MEAPYSRETDGKTGMTLGSVGLLLWPLMSGAGSSFFLASIECGLKKVGVSAPQDVWEANNDTKKLHFDGGKAENGPFDILFTEYTQYVL